MCSRKWLTPSTPSHSSRAPVFTKKPSADVCASGLHSATISRPLSSVTSRNSKRHLQRLLTESHNGEIARRMIRQVGIDARAAQPVDELAHFVQRADAAQVIPIAGHRAAAGR